MKVKSGETEGFVIQQIRPKRALIGFKYQVDTINGSRQGQATSREKVTISSLNNDLEEILSYALVLCVDGTHLTSRSHL